MVMNAVLLARKPLFVVAGLLALTCATWSCTSSSGKGGGGSGGSGGNAGNSGTGGSCMALNAPAPPGKSCDPSKDITTECPLPDTITESDGSYTTVYYYSNPSCVSGKCVYCSTSTTSEDPNATAAP
ncbi:MAG: hypothetical protein QM820_26970 [Minicystis sp.]